MHVPDNNREAALVWLRNDLRLHDHEPLARATAAGIPVVLLYCADPRHFQPQLLDIPRTGVFRTRFLLEAVHALRAACRARGAELVVRTGPPETVVPEVARTAGVTQAYFHSEPAPEERDVERAVVAALEGAGVSVHASPGHTLVDARDLPFAIDDLPPVFSSYRKRVDAIPVRAELPVPPHWDVVPLPAGDIPTLPELGLQDVPVSTQALFQPRGGEAEGLARLQHWVWDARALGSYKRTRNGLLTVDDSSKLSPWLALGCLSPRRLYAEVARYEAAFGRTDDSQWMVFELHWRDYFRWLVARAGATLFAPGGLNALRFPWRTLQQAEGAAAFAQWTRGDTGFPLVDAAMRELRATGYTSNRARQNAASFLARVLGVDWRLGAAWFESYLVDYDVGSNWGNWAYVAGVGTDARGFRFFNVHKQALDYDPTGAFARHWIPSLRGVPDGRVYQPAALSTEERLRFNVRLGDTYPEPMVDLHAAATANGARYAEAVASLPSRTVSSNTGSMPRLAKRKL